MIRTKTPVKVDLYHDLEHVVYADLISITFYPEKKEFATEVMYSYIDPKTSSKVELKTDETVKSQAEIDALFTAIGRDIIATESFANAYKFLVDKGTELVIKASGYFGLTPSDWELI